MDLVYLSVVAGRTLVGICFGIVSSVAKRRLGSNLLKKLFSFLVYLDRVRLILVADFLSLVRVLAVQVPGYSCFVGLLLLKQEHFFQILVPYFIIMQVLV